MASQRARNLRPSNDLMSRGLAPDFAASWTANHARFPCGVDLDPVRWRDHRRPAAQQCREGLMAYVAVKGGERAIDNAHAWLAEARRGDTGVAELALDQIAEPARPCGRPRDGRRLALRPRTGGAGDQAGAGRSDRGGVPAARLPHDLAALRATEPIDTDTMHIRRRVSAIFKDLPGGQVLGPTYDYTHRLLDFALADRQHAAARARRPRPDRRRCRASRTSWARRG